MIFAYPSAAHPRRHGPAGYTDYQSYKPWLRDEFTFRCVFCLVRERWYAPMAAHTFSVEHLVPKTHGPDRECDYDNLLYACVRCNSVKRDVWPVLDPCKAAYGHHLAVSDDGIIKGLTREGKKLVKVMRLDNEALTRLRRNFLAYLRAARAKPDGSTADLLRQLLGFPDDLPDLAAFRPPGGNIRPHGLNDSHYARRARGELPAEY